MASGVIYVNKYSECPPSACLISVGCNQVFASWFNDLRHPYCISSQPLKNLSCDL